MQRWYSNLIVERQHVDLVSVIERERVRDGLGALAVQRAPLRLSHAPAERVHHYFGRATAAVVQLKQKIHI